MSTTTQPPDITAHLDAAERAAATLVVELCAAFAMVPEGDGFNDLRYALGEALRAVQSASKLGAVRSTLAEMARIKGPMVEIVRPSYGLRNVVERVEVKSITSAAIVVRGGEHFARRSGRRTRPMTSGPCPYITEAERARVLALPRPPATARPRAASKEPRP